jgi:DNA polymerase III delta prime subunit
MATLQSILNCFEHLILINGTGKTTTATLVARESGRDVLELNASDARSKKALGEALGDVTGSQVLSFENMGKGKKKSNVAVVRRKRCIIMDEVDGMGAGDRSGMSELIQMIKKSKVPIVSKCVHVINCVHPCPPILPITSCFPCFLCNVDDTDLHLQRPFLSQNEIPRPILHGSQVFPSNENGHCKTCRRNRPS